LVGQQQRFVDVVRNHEGRHRTIERCAERHQLLLQVAARESIEGAERLVEKENLGLRSESPRDRDPLSHAARELSGSAVKRISKSDELEIPDGLGPLLVSRPGRKRGGDRQLNVADRRQPGQQGIVLKHERGPLRHPSNNLTCNRNAAAVGTKQPCDQIQ
jgi:hypothetical protein